MIYINRLRLINYKVFEDKVINLSEGLNVFSGPNGYGKTSLFDAIELLITGNIKRIQQNELIDGRNTYDEHYIAKNREKNVVIKGEFVEHNDSKEHIYFTVVKIIPIGKSNNPKNLVETTKTYILDNFDDEINDTNYYEKHPSEFLSERFGETTQTELYRTLYYIEQENRLSYFKQSERNRVGAIRTLFGMAEEIKKLEGLDNAVKKVNSIVKKLQLQKKEIETQLSISSENTEEKPVEFFSLLNNAHAWDAHDVLIPTKEILDGYISELIAIKSLLINKENFRADITNQQCDRLLSDDIGMMSYIQKSLVERNSEDFLEWEKSYHYFETIISLIDKKKYLEIDFLKLGKKLDIETVKENELLLSIKQLEQQLSGSQKTLSEIIELRAHLQQKHRLCDPNMQTNECIYCGYDWSKKNESLEERFVKVTELLNEQANSSAKNLSNAKEKLEKMLIENCLPSIRKSMESLQDRKLFLEYENNKLKIVEGYNSYNGRIINLEIDFLPLLNESDQDVVLYNAQMLKSILSKKKKELPPEYYNSKQIYNFDQVAQTYFFNTNDLNKVLIDSVEKKISFIKYRYYMYHEEKKCELEKIKHLHRYLNDNIKTEIKKYRDKYQSCIAEYQRSVIAGIEIPFYIYTSRLLQSYPGGQGILIKTGKVAKLEDGIDSIRFVVPNKTHDVLYTMSSGQLSGVLLSFTLALYKTFTEQKFSTLLIDDPVQSMDDVNVVSLVELLKSEFGNIQVLISTHEEIFAKYSTYKYSKARLVSQIIKLKDEL